MRRLGMTVAASLMALVASARAYEHLQYEAVSLDGAWEMAYLPYAWESVRPPSFTGVTIPNAVPGYWEDMEAAFRKAGMKESFRINPVYEKQSFPISDYADDMTLPNIRGSFVYRRQVQVTRPGRAVLAFEGVRNKVHVWINGTFVAFREGFSTPFELEVPSELLKAGMNEIVLAVSNDPTLGYCGAEVTGLTTRALFRSTGGVNGHLELRFLKSDLADVHVTTARDLASFTVHAAGGVEFDYEIRDGARRLVRGHASGEITLPTEGYDFWSPESPKRYELVLTTEAGECRQLFGLRRLIADGEKLRLNGRPVYLRGVTEHCYFARTVHVPRDLDYFRMVTVRRKELGFNFVRFHTFVPPVEYLEATDELGMLVQIESPNFVSEPEYAAIIAFARRHPSVVIYCTGNETRIDRLAETYLEDVAALVHSRTDALFSPMSALRGIEYQLMPGKDAIVQKPFEHNPERMRRVAAYADLFNSYQLEGTSYDALNKVSVAELDAWGDAYCGKPRLSHEICIDGSYVDFSLEKLYPADSPVLKTGVLDGLRRQLAEKGLLDRSDAYFRNSCEWMRRIRKHCFEKVRAADRVAGYDFLGDINTHWHTFGYSVGMMDEFYRLKPGETVANVLRYNSAAVILSSFGSDFTVEAGKSKIVSFGLSNYSDEARNARLTVSLVKASGETVWHEARACGMVSNGRLSPLGDFSVRYPVSGRPEKYYLRAEFASDVVLAENEWETYAFPTYVPSTGKAPVRVVTDISEADLVVALERGERVLLFGTGPFRSLPSSFRIGLAGRCSGDFATVIARGHPALGDFPHEGYCGWAFRRLMEGGRTVQLEGDVPFDPIIDVASAVKFVIRQSSLFEYRIGKGWLLVCSLRFDGEDPAARWLKCRLEDYAGSEAFCPKDVLTFGQLHALANAPLLSGEENTNRARNPNDSSDLVRAYEFAQP